MILLKKSCLKSLPLIESRLHAVFQALSSVLILLEFPKTQTRVNIVITTGPCTHSAVFVLCRNLLTNNVAFGTGDAKKTNPAGDGKESKEAVADFEDKRWVELKKAREAYEERLAQENGAVVPSDKDAPQQSALKSRNFENSNPLGTHFGHQKAQLALDAASQQSALKAHVPESLNPVCFRFGHKAPQLAHAEIKCEINIC